LQIGIARGDDGRDRRARPRGVDNRHQVGRRHQNLGAAIGQLVTQFVLTRQRPARYDDAAQLGRGQMGHDGLRTVVQKQRNAIAACHAQSLQLHRQPRGGLIQLAPADRAAIPQQGDALGCLLRMEGAIPVQRHLARQIVDRFTVMDGHVVSPRPPASRGDTSAVMAALVAGRSCGSGFAASIIQVWRSHLATAAPICAKPRSTHDLGQT
jgi:hypothetical protein